MNARRALLRASAVMACEHDYAPVVCPANDSGSWEREFFMMLDVGHDELASAILDGQGIDDLTEAGA